MMKGVSGTSYSGTGNARDQSSGGTAVLYNLLSEQWFGSRNTGAVSGRLWKDCPRGGERGCGKPDTCGSTCKNRPLTPQQLTHSEGGNFPACPSTFYT